MKKVTFTNLRTWLMENLLLVITFSGVSLGVIIGILLKPLDLDPITISYIAYPGELFMRLLTLMILPLIIASLITGKF
jgi:solute carrier family 1 (high affinity glutamate transporter) protein 2